MTNKRFIEMHATLQSIYDDDLNNSGKHLEETCLDFIKNLCAIYHGKNSYILLGDKIAIYKLSNTYSSSDVPPNAYFRFLLPTLEVGDDIEHYIRTAEAVWQTTEYATNESYFDIV